MMPLKRRKSLRDIVANFSVLAHRLYHLDNAKLTPCMTRKNRE